MHHCVQKLLGVTNDDLDGNVLMDSAGNPMLREVAALTATDEENIEALVRLLTTIGKKLEADCVADGFKTALVRLYLERLNGIAKDRAFPSRMRFMVQDYLELRGNNYVPRRKEDKQMTQEQIRKLAAKEMGGGPVPLAPAVPMGGGGQGGKGGGGQGGQGGKGGKAGKGNGGQGGGGSGGGNQDSRGGKAQKGQQQQQQQGKGKQHGDVKLMTRGQPPASAPSPQRAAPVPARPSPPPPAAAAVSVAASTMPHDVLKDRVKGLVSDWTAARSEAEATEAWAELLAAGAGGELATEAAAQLLDKASEAAERERGAVADLALFLCKGGHLNPPALAAALHEFLEFMQVQPRDGAAGRLRAEPARVSEGPWRRARVHLFHVLFLM